jgi:hypothetical protein
MVGEELGEGEGTAASGTAGALSGFDGAVRAEGRLNLP